MTQEVRAEPLIPDQRATPWPEAMERLGAAGTYWLVTTGTDGRPHKYDWHVTPRDGAFHDVEGAPTAGPPPYEVYALTATKAYGFATDEAVNSTRWTSADWLAAG